MLVAASGGSPMTTARNVLLVGLILLTAAANGGDDFVGFRSIFNGRDLTGWEGSPEYWKVEDGCLTGVADGTLKFNRFIVWRGGKVKNFELRVKVKVSPGGNSGLQYRSTERPDLGESVDQVFRQVGIRAVNVLCARSDLLVGELAERVLDRDEVLVQVARTGSFVRQPGEELRIAVGGQEFTGTGERIGLNAPECFAAHDPVREFGDRIRDEGIGDTCLDFALGAVGEQRVGRLHCCSRMCEVVVEHLIGVGPARQRSECLGAGRDD
jgi:hypothetical protein